jgi:hypothetical protein
MSKGLPLIFAGLCSLVIGLGVSDVWSRVHTIPYCRVARNADSYAGRYIRVKGRLIFGSDGMYIFESCDPVEALASLVEFDGDRTSQTRNYVDEVLVTGEKSRVQTAEALIEGDFDANFSRGCWGPKFRIAARKIQLVSPVIQYSP